MSRGATIAARNAHIFHTVERGVPLWAVAAEHGLSRQWVYRIVWIERLRRSFAEDARGRIVGDDAA